MLTADQITALGDKVQKLIDPIVEFLIEDIARRISEAGQLTSTAAYQVWRLQQLGVSQSQLKKKLKKILKVTEKELQQLLTQAAETGYNYDLKSLPHTRAVPFKSNEAIQNIVNASVQLAQDDLSNIVQTIGFVNQDGVVRTLTEAYQKASDFAFQKVSTGAQDYNTAVREATRELLKKGIRTIDYESGVHTSLDAAVRRNVLGGLGLMQEKISQQNHDDLGCDGWEISAHAASAPDHEPIQGKQYSDEDYEKLNDSLVRRIGTLNCGHSAHPIILGVNSPQYTPSELEKMRQDNEKGIEYEGKHYTMYQATQRQRELERAIRNRRRRILADKATGDEERLAIDQIKLVRLQDEYVRFSKAAGLRTQDVRMEVAGFGPKQMKAAKEAAEDVFRNPPKDLQELSVKVDRALNQHCIRDSKWSGKIIVQTRETMPKANGRKEWNCDISLRNTVGIKTVVHELLHARSVSYYDDRIYKQHQGIEEGAVELFAQEICSQNNVAFKVAYLEEVTKLHIINNILRNGDRYSFAKQLFDIPLPERYNWLRKQADELIATGKLSKKTVKGLNDAVEYFRGKDLK